MKSHLVLIGAWLRRRAEEAAVAMLAIMFLAFMIQIASRYVFSLGAGWAYELSILCWLWAVLWGAAFIVREKDEIRFDVIYSLVSHRLRVGFTIVTGVAILILYAYSLPAVTDYVQFMKVQKSAYLNIRFNWLYSIYLVFAVAALVRYAWLTWAAFHGRTPVSFVDSTKTGTVS